MISIEISQQLYQAAQNRFAKDSSIRLINEDSARAIPRLLPQIDEDTPTLFWLDSHFSGSRFETARGETDTSLLPELHAVLNHANQDHVILIDDARLFQGFDKCQGHYAVECYPSLESIQKLVCHSKPDWIFEVVDDIVRIYRPRVGKKKDKKKDKKKVKKAKQSKQEGETNPQESKSKKKKGKEGTIATEQGGATDPSKHQAKKQRKKATS
mmetsp:Transcript_58127/g.137036  ORF Transcript_58127/g.137036 Transcript_58127/m.137036 type:complete len:212 (+) Transcript_58127:494-1129(+)